MKILGERRRNPLLCRSSTRYLLVLGSEDGSLSLQAQGGGKTVFTAVTTWRALLREGRARFERDVAELQPGALLGGLCLSVGVRQQQGTAPTWTGWFTLREALSTANKGSFPDKICLGRTGPKADNPRTAEKVPEWGPGTGASPLAVGGCYAKVTFQQNLVPPPVRFGVWFSPPAFLGKRKVPSLEFSLREGIMCPVPWGLVKLLNSCLAGPGELLSQLNPYVSPVDGEGGPGLPWGLASRVCVGDAGCALAGPRVLPRHWWRSSCRPQPPVENPATQERNRL